MKTKSFSIGFTLVELLVAVSIIAILATVVLSTNIISSFQKARDSSRKQDLNKLIRILEDYYNDNQRYPQGDPNGTIKDAHWGYAFFSYPIVLPKDPLSNSNWLQYYYLTDASKQDFYSIFAKLENQNDPEIQKLGCGYGCGPVNLFNYYVTSPNTVLIAGLPNGQMPQGGNPLYGDPEAPTGIPTATPTATPVPPTATPTLNLNPPTDGTPCVHNQCCRFLWCGQASSELGGVNCGFPNARCNYESTVPPFGWGCGSNPLCP